MWFAAMRDRLSLKVFFGLAALLLAIGLGMYALIMAMMPAHYTSTVTGNFQAQMQSLVATLEAESSVEGMRTIYDFCLDHGTVATLESSAGNYSFGSMSEMKDGGAATATTVVRFADGTLAKLSVMASQQAANEMMATFWRLLPALALIVLVVSALAALGCTRLLTRRIVRLSAVSERLAALDLQQRVGDLGGDEIGVLGRNLDTMAAQLDETMRALAAANAQLSADIDRAERLQAERRDFFAAASHELKTPLAVLKGQLEGMIAGVGLYRNRDHALRQALGTTRRMEQLVAEILTLAKLERDDLPRQEAPVDLSRLTARLCRSLAGVAEDRAQHFEVALSEAVVVSGEQVLLEKAFSNIIGNAIFHSPPGAQICVKLEKDHLCVTNSDVHIEAALLPGLFRPFTRSDPSRSRDGGGSGLGLSIVKAVCERHGFTYRLENTTTGVAFTVVWMYNEEK